MIIALYARGCNSSVVVVKRYVAGVNGGVGWYGEENGWVLSMCWPTVSMSWHLSPQVLSVVYFFSSQVLCFFGLAIECREQLLLCDYSLWTSIYCVLRENIHRQALTENWLRPTPCAIRVQEKEKIFASVIRSR